MLPSLKLTAKAPGNGWLEDFLVSFWGVWEGLFSGANFAVSFGEGTPEKKVRPTRFHVSQTSIPLWPVTTAAGTCVLAQQLKRLCQSSLDSSLLGALGILEFQRVGTWCFRNGGTWNP